MVLIHPSSSMFGDSDDVEWILYHELVWTSKVFARTVCPVQYAWIKDLLPKIHEVAIGSYCVMLISDAF